MDNLPSSIPHIKAGRLHALAVMSDKRVEALPEVPTFAEVGSIAAGGTPQAFAQTAARELALRKDIVRKQKIVLD